jgi:paraquat-inducible protein B
MSKKANPKVVGSFVVGAMALAILGIMLLGGGSLLETTFDCVLYFDESISGLDVGAPVDFQGVRIGTVTDVWMEFDGVSGAAYRPVKLQIEEKRIRHVGAGRLATKHAEGMELLVQKRGLRARLASQSMLTGKLKVELGFFPDRPIVRVNRDKQVWEMPTIPSTMRQMTEDVAELPLGEIVSEIHRVVQRVGDALDPKEVGKVFANLNRTMERMEALLARVEAKVDPLAEQGAGVLTSIQGATEDARKTLATVNAQLAPLMASLTASSDQARALLDTRVPPLMDSLAKTSDGVGALLQPHSPLSSDLAALLEELRRTSQSLGRFVDYLDQHPEALLRGKQP